MMRPLAFVAALALAMTPADGQKPATAGRPPAAAPDLTVDVDFLVGMWSDQQDCSGSLIEFRRDGTFVNLDQSHGTWRLGGDTLTLSGSISITVRLVPRNNFELNTVNADGSQGYSRRCIGPNRPLVR